MLVKRPKSPNYTFLSREEDADSSWVVLYSNLTAEPYHPIACVSLSLSHSHSHR
ncbi:hypothetical protein Fmac_005536 [Flemingia macrophylla]|uniref:Uncharacterized protein n=1 Tax=Flemingia macrophylla TaxID=520843 RepID=A0ABD1N8M0_9FABA